MNILGLDLSINSSGIAYIQCDEHLKVTSLRFLGFTKVKKNEIHSEGLDICLLDKSYGDIPYHHRGEIIFKEISKYINLDSVNFFAVEDYAYGATGAVFDIAEVCGSIKEKLYLKNIPYKKYPPSSIKQFATGKGMIDKIEMGIAFNKLNVKISDNLEDFKSPKSDLVDAFWIAQLMRFELYYQKFGIFPDDLFTEMPEHSTEAIIGGGKKKKTEPTLSHPIYRFHV